MEKSFIWDLDGTLFDSYPVIGRCVWESVCLCGLTLPREELEREILQSSIYECFLRLEREYGLSNEALHREHHRLTALRAGEIPLMDGAEKTLTELRALGGRHFVFTNRGATAEEILTRLGIRDYFEEVVTALSGFPRKPSGAGVDYLTEKYGLGRVHCFYVGDRLLDVDCARNAGVGAVLFCPAGSVVTPNGRETLRIEALQELPQYWDRL